MANFFTMLRFTVYYGFVVCELKIDGISDKTENMDMFVPSNFLN